MRGRALPLKLAAALMVGVLVLPLGVALLCGSAPADMDDMPGMQHPQQQTATHAESRVAAPGALLGCVSLATCASQQPTVFASPTRFEPASRMGERDLAPNQRHVVEFTSPPSTPPPKA